jgi:hypothetical protein
LPSKTQPTSINTSRPWVSVTAYVDPCRVSQTHAGNQQLVSEITLVLAFQFGQLDLAINAQHFPLAIGLRGAHRQAFGHRQRDNIGQVILALGIVVLGQFAQPVGQDGPSEWP